MFDLPFILLGLIVFLSYTTQAITGFGSTVIALTLGAQFYTIPELLPVLVALNLPLCAWVVARNPRQVDRNMLVKGIFPWMTLGFVIGVLVAGILAGDVMKKAFGGLVIVVSAIELFGMWKGKVGAMLSPAAFRTWVVGAGLTQGVYASGGPMLVYAVSKTGLDRSRFRATLLAVWLIFNGALLVTYLARGNWDSTAGMRTLALLPLIPLGIVVGDWLHHKVPEKGFTYLVHTCLLIAGAALLR